MRIYLVRHGDSSFAMKDDERPLSEKGQQDIQKIAAFLTPLHLKVTKLFHSKKLRAQLTAEILATSLSPTPSVESRLELDPMHPIEPMMDEILAWDEDVMLVGHMPFMGKLVAELVNQDSNNSVVDFQAGSMVCLERIGRNQWIICWMLSPELF